MQKPGILIFAILLIVIVVSLSIWLTNDQDQPLSQTCLSFSDGIAQSQGTDGGTADYETYAGLAIPPLHPEQALDRFELEEGFRIEVVAHEPMIADPVAMDIDADGRLWVVEMPSYNMDAHDILVNTDERTTEREQALYDQMPPEELKGRVVILEDTDGDGKMDTHRVFYDGLFRPRAIKVLSDGVLVGEPPNLWVIRDTNKDGKGDSKELIFDSFGVDDPTQVQSLPGGLAWGLDNWIHSAHGFPSIRRKGDLWLSRHQERLGQWGISQNDWGRFYSSSNGWPLETTLVPYGYSQRHPIFRVSSGKSARIAPNRPVWPAHAPATNRNYRIGHIAREDGSIKVAAGTASTVIYRGDQFGEHYRGNAFTPIAAGNLIKRILIDEDPAEIEADASFAYEEREFLTSTDERFRPINIYNAPDGSLYIVDMYRGLYDYLLWVTDHLREYSLKNELYKPTGKFGRIYRVVRDDRQIDYQTPKFSSMTHHEVLAYLHHENGHLRDQAQQVLVQCFSASVVPSLEQIVFDSSAEAYTRLHALWTLEGLNRSDYGQERLTEISIRALNDTHPRMRSSAIRILESELGQNSSDVLAHMKKMIDDESPYVQLQLLASLGESTDDEALALMASILNANSEVDYFQEMALTGVYQREEKFSQILIKNHNWSEDGSEGQEFIFTSLVKSKEEAGDIDLDHLTQDQRDLFFSGQVLYETCIACHGDRGQGSGVGSALNGSSWVQGEPEALVRIVLQGFEGGATERGDDISGVMPAHGYLSNQDISSILTFIRQSWDNEASPVETGDVGRIRVETENRGSLWTPEELRTFKQK